MAANCLIYRRCRANAINKPLYREDSFVSMSIVFPVVRIRLEREKNTRHSHFPRVTHSLDSYCFFDLYNIEHRLLFVSFCALVFPPPEPSFTLSLFRSYDTRTQLPPPHPPAEKTRRGKWNWRSEWSIPANILSLKVYKSPRIFIHSANVYFVHIYTSWPEYLHENGYTGGGFFKY